MSLSRFWDPLHLAAALQGATFSSAPPQESASQLSHPSQIVDGSAASVDTSSASDYISQTNPAIEALLGAAAPLGLEVRSCVSAGIA